MGGSRGARILSEQKANLFAIAEFGSSRGIRPPNVPVDLTCLRHVAVAGDRIQTRVIARGSVMKSTYVGGAAQAGRCLNAVALQNAVLCAECDVVSDSPNDRCLVCGSRSLFNIARMFGGDLPKDRASLIASDKREETSYEQVLSFPAPGRLRAKAAG